MKNLVYNWLYCAFDRKVAENPKGFVIIVIATYAALC